MYVPEQLLIFILLSINFPFAMKKQRLLLLLVLLGFSFSTFAGNVDITTARKAGQNYYSAKTATDNRANLIDEEFVIQGQSGNSCYIFNFVDGGFVIISAEDTYSPVMGYSLHGKYVADKMPDGFNYLLNSYKGMVDYLRTNPTEASSEISQAWNALKSNRAATYPKSGSKGVNNLMMSTWNQDDPYNYLCPEDPAGPGGHVYAGCVATAMSQVMFYWRWPATGQGQSSYYASGYGTLSANYGATEYHFDRMVHNSDNKYNFYDAQLQSHAGISVRMGYAPDGSGAFSYNVPSAMKSYFRYASATYKERTGVAQATWENLVKGDLDQKKVVYYSGRDVDNGGHAFVCTGYNDETPTLFYFNFGWSGSGDGYYSINDVGGFFNSQAMVYQISPNSEYPTSAPESSEYTNMEGTIEDGSGPIANYLANKTASYLINPQTAYDSVTKITLNFKRFDLGTGDLLKIYDGGDANATLIGTYDASNVPSSITSTSNRVFMVFTSDGSSEANGWLCEYTSVEPMWCTSSKTFTEPTGVISDGSGSFYYKDKTTCMFKISVPYASQITINFNYFDTEADNDILKIMNAAAGNQVVTTLSGSYSTPPAPVVVPSGKATLMFQTNDNTRANGWEVNYEILNVGVESRDLLSNFRLWPNPVSDNLNIDFDVDNSQNFQLKLVDLTGKSLYTEHVANYSGHYQTAISVKNLSAGIYFMVVTGDKGTFSRKVIVK